MSKVAKNKTNEYFRTLKPNYSKEPLNYKPLVGKERERAIKEAIKIIRQGEKVRAKYKELY